MRKGLFLIIILISININAQKSVPTKNESIMETIRLIYPQWQGGDIARWIPEVAMIWIDAHPDITLPGDVYPGYHAMAVTACMGLGDHKIISELPARFSPSKILFVGIRD